MMDKYIAVPDKDEPSTWRFIHADDVMQAAQYFVASTERLGQYVPEGEFFKIYLDDDGIIDIDGQAYDTDHVPPIAIKWNVND